MNDLSCDVSVTGRSSGPTFPWCCLMSFIIHWMPLEWSNFFISYFRKHTISLSRRLLSSFRVCCSSTKTDSASLWVLNFVLTSFACVTFSFFFSRMAFLLALNAFFLCSWKPKSSYWLSLILETITLRISISYLLILRIIISLLFSCLNLLDLSLIFLSSASKSFFSFTSSLSCPTTSSSSSNNLSLRSFICSHSFLMLSTSYSIFVVFC